MVQPGDHRNPLIVALGLLTAVSGVVDAVCFLALGRVFVANQTGNVVLLGFAVVGAPGLSVLAPCWPSAGFWPERRFARLFAMLALSRRALVATLCLALSCVGAAAATQPAAGHAGSTRYLLTAMLAFAVGLQGLLASSLGVADMPTTVLTRTLTALAGDSPVAAGTNPRWRRRAVTPVAMIVGAAAGGALVLNVSVPCALAAALALIVVAAASSSEHRRSSSTQAGRGPSGVGIPGRRLTGRAEAQAATRAWPRPNRGQSSTSRRTGRDRPRSATRRLVLIAPDATDFSTLCRQASRTADSRRQCAISAIGH